MIMVYSNRNFLPVLREVDMENENRVNRVCCKDVNTENHNYYNNMFNEIDSEYIDSME